MKKKRSLASCIQEFWPATILTPIFVIGEVAFDVLIPLMTGKLLDEGVKAGSMHHIAAYGLTVVGMAVLALICGGLSGRFGAKASTASRGICGGRCIGMSRSSPLPTLTSSPPAASSPA